MAAARCFICYAPKLLLLRLNFSGLEEPGIAIFWTLTANSKSNMRDMNYMERQRPSMLVLKFQKKNLEGNGRAVNFAIEIQRLSSYKSVL